MSMFKAGVLATLIPLALAAPAVAQQGPGRGMGPQMMFSEMDLDGDGAVTLQELQTAREGRFTRADADGDGLVTRDELIAQAMTRAGDRIDRLLEQADGDGDGALSAAELDSLRETRRMAGMERMFERADTDGDGTITEAEFEAMADHMGEPRGHHGDRRGHGHGFWRG